MARYRGALFFSLALTVHYIWYALSFGSHFFVLAFLIGLFSVFLCFVAAMNFRRVSGIAAVGAWCAMLWSVYITVLSAFFFFFL